MGSLSDYSEDALIDHVLGVSAYTPITTLYIGLSTADPLDDATGLTEPSGMSYVRQTIAFSAAASRAVIQNGEVAFPEATGDWTTITHYGIFDAETNGNMLAHGSLNPTKDVPSGKTIKIPDTQTQISITSGAMSTYLADALMDFMFRDQAYTQPSTFVALIETTEVVDADDGTTIDELDMTDYAREATGTWGASSGGTSTNDALIDFGALTGTGETITSAAIVDNATTALGNVLFYDNALNVVVDTGDNVSYAAGQFSINLS